MSAAATSAAPGILEPGYELTLRPMRYKGWFDAYLASLDNNWRVAECNFTRDVSDLRDEARMTKAQVHMIKRLVGFFATGDSLVSNNVAVVLYRHINAPEARMYLSRQLFEESMHIHGYLTILDSYVEDMREREAMFSAVKNVPSIAMKADFCMRWMDDMASVDRLDTDDKKQRFLLNVLTFAGAVEGMFFYAAFVYVFFMRSRGLLPGLGQITNWVFRDETMHMASAFEVIRVAREQYPHLFNESFWDRYRAMLDDAIACEHSFSKDLLSGGVGGLSERDMKSYLYNIADQRLVHMGLRPVHGHANPFDFMVHQDLAEVTNFFERRSTSYGQTTTGAFSLDADF